MVLSWWERLNDAHTNGNSPSVASLSHISLTKDDMSFEKHFYIIMFVPKLGLMVVITCCDLASKKKIAIKGERVRQSYFFSKKALSAKCD